jgi:hypothetical protein
MNRDNLGGHAFRHNALLFRPITRLGSNGISSVSQPRAGIAGVALLLICALFAAGCATRAAGDTTFPQMYRYGERQLAASECTVRLVLAAKTFEAPDFLAFSISTQESKLFLEFPEDVGLRVEKDDPPSEDPPPLVPRSGTDLIPCLSPVDSGAWFWDHEAEPGPPGTLRRVPRGRYRVVMRYLPGPGYSGSKVCISRSEPFDVREDGVLLETGP